MENTFFALAIFLLIVAIWDCFTYKIPNILILVGLIGFPLLIVYKNGWLTLGTSLLSFIICSAVLYTIWKVSRRLNLPLIGAGDFKLFMVLSLVVGIGDTFTIFYYSIILGGLSFIFLLPPRTTARMVSSFFSFLFYGIPFLPENKIKKIPYSIPIALTTYLVLQHPSLLPFTF